MPIPTDFANLLAWWKADALSLANNDPVASWTDSSGNGNHAVQATEAKKPLFKTGILGGSPSLPVVRFDGTDDGLADTITFASTIYTLFAVVRSLTGGSIQQAIASDNDNVGGAARFFQFRYTATTAEFVAFNNAESAFVDDQATDETAWHILSGVRDTSDVQVWVDGTSGGATATTGTAQDAGAKVVNLGFRQTAVPDTFLNGDIAEAFIYDAVLSDTDRQALEAYLTAKWFPTTVDMSVGFLNIGF